MDDSNKPPATRPGELVIATSEERVLVRIQPDGTIIYGPEYTPDEAAKVLWEALARKRKDDEDRRIFFAHIEHLMIKLGEHDLRYEACQLKAKAPGATAHDHFQEERAAEQWEIHVHQLVELARGFVLRNRAAENNPPPKPSSSMN